MLPRATAGMPPTAAGKRAAPALTFGCDDILAAWLVRAAREEQAGEDRKK